MKTSSRQVLTLRCKGLKYSNSNFTSEETCHWGLQGYKIHWQNCLLICRSRPLLIFWHLHTRVTTPTLAESLLINSEHSWPNGSITVASAQNSLKTLHKLECRGQTPKDQCLNLVVVWWRSKSHINEELHLYLSEAARNVV